jgi:hypothetical protein
MEDPLVLVALPFIVNSGAGQRPSSPGGKAVLICCCTLLGLRKSFCPREAVQACWTDAAVQVSSLTSSGSPSIPAPAGSSGRGGSHGRTSSSSLRAALRASALCWPSDWPTSAPQS